jgi:ribA/ribD-fused uncharacterized protein
MSSKEITTLEDMLRAVRSGFRPKYLFFWGHSPLPSGEIGKSCLSQWWPAKFTIGGLSYPTAEHFMMAEKARLFGDNERREQILNSTSPKLAKHHGRQVKGFEEQIWGDVRFDLVVQGNFEKFSQNNRLGAFLIGTGNRVLVEASPVDRIWGIGLGADNLDILNPEKWRGLNLLGFALMKVRQRLLEKER